MAIAIVVLSGASVAGAAQGQSDEWQLTLDETLSYDDNLFRLPSGVAPAGGNAARSSLIRIDRLGLSWNKSYSLQRLRVDANVADHHYSNHGFLDFTGVGGSAAWDWSFTPHLTGVISAGRSQTLDSFADYRNQSARNLRTNENRVAAADWEIGGSWHLIGAATDYSSISEDNTLPVEDSFRARGGQAGLKYVFPSASYLSYVTRHEDGEYPGQSSPALLKDWEYRQRADELQGVWTYSEKLVFSGRLTSSRRHHPNFSARDYSGITSRFDLRWIPSHKTSLTTTVARDFSTFQSAYSNYIVTNAISVAPLWQITAKTGLSAQLACKTRDYLGEPFGPVPMRRDKLRSVRLEISWQALRSAALSFALQRETRESTYPDFVFDDNRATLKLGLTF